MISQEDISSSILINENKMVFQIIESAKNDACGMWEESVSILEEASKYSNIIGVLKTTCKDADISDFVNENTGIQNCDIDNDRGIGEWAIKPSLRGCNVFKIRKGLTPPPFGEFSQSDFLGENFTKVTT